MLKRSFLPTRSTETNRCKLPGNFSEESPSNPILLAGHEYNDFHQKPDRRVPDAIKHHATPVHQMSGAGITESLRMMSGLQKTHTNDSRQLSSHILPTSATMVGVCMTVLSIGRLSQAGRLGVLVDKLLAGNAVLFLISAILSFLSIRFVVRGRTLEGWAEDILLLGLVLITLTAVLIAFAIDL